MPDFLGWLLTFLFFAVSLVLFRSADFSVTAQMWTAMSGADGLAWQSPRRRFRARW